MRFVRSVRGMFAHVFSAARMGALAPVAVALVHCSASEPAVPAPVGGVVDAGSAQPDANDASGYACATSPLTYSNFGEPFMLSWCRGCHSAGLAEGARQGAPLGVDFETREKVTQWKLRIVARASSTPPTMPPRGGPAATEIDQLREWIACGMK